MNRTSAIVAALFLGVLMLIAVGDNPYGYYQFLRIATLVIALFIAYVVYNSDEENKAVWFFVAVAILFNPFLPIYLDKSLWVIINILVAVILPLVTILSLKSAVKTVKS
jgi:hypothetical protein